MAGWRFWRTSSPLSEVALPTSPEAKFWRWFEQNEGRLFEVERNQIRVFAELEVALKSVHPGLAFQFGPKSSRQREFVISAEGIRAVFPAVAALVSVAPALERWNFVAFRPRIDAADIAFETVELAATEAFFAGEVREGHVDLTVFLPDRLFSDDRVRLALCFLMLDGVLGEYDVATKIGKIETKPLSTIAERAPIGELARFVDERLSRGAAN
jgi:hypothetical protein